MKQTSFARRLDDQDVGYLDGPVGAQAEFPEQATESGQGSSRPTTIVRRQQKARAVRQNT